MPTYVATSDLTARFDVRDIQQLVLDDASDSTVVDVSDNPIVETALDDAEGEVISALRKGGRYNAARLAALTGADLSYLKRIVCDIAMVHLLRRRPTFNPEVLETQDKARKGYLKDLQDGSSVITGDEPAAIEAGAISNEGPTLGEWNNLNLWRDRANYFPGRRYP